MICELCRRELAHPKEPLPECFAEDTDWHVNGEWRRPKRMQRDMLKILWARRGHAVSTDAFMVLLYETRDNPPMGEIVRKQIHELRRLIAGSGYSIQTIARVGWALHETGARDSAML